MPSLVSYGPVGPRRRLRPRCSRVRRFSFLPIGRSRIDDDIAAVAVDDDRGAGGNPPADIVKTDDGGNAE